MIAEVSLEILGMDSFLPIGCEHIEIPYWEGYKLLCVCVCYVNVKVLLFILILLL